MNILAVAKIERAGWKLKVEYLATWQKYSTGISCACWKIIICFPNIRASRPLPSRRVNTTFERWPLVGRRIPHIRPMRRNASSSCPRGVRKTRLRCHRHDSFNVQCVPSRCGALELSVALLSSKDGLNHRAVIEEDDRRATIDRAWRLRTSMCFAAHSAVLH